MVLNKIKSTSDNRGFHQYSSEHSFNAMLPKGSRGKRPISDFKAIYEGMPSSVVKSAEKKKSSRQTALELRERNQLLKEISMGYRKMPKKMEEELIRRQEQEQSAKLKEKESLKDVKLAEEELFHQKASERTDAKLRRKRIASYDPDYIRKEALLKEKIKEAESRGDMGDVEDYQADLKKLQKREARLAVKAIEDDIRVARKEKRKRIYHAIGAPIRGVKKVSKALYIPGAVSRAESMASNVPSHRKQMEEARIKPIF